MRQSIEDLLALLGRFPLAVLEFGLRLGVGATFFKSGLVKIASWQQTVALFEEEYRVPVLPAELAATLGAAAELICPVLLVAGIGARFGAAALLGMTFVIQTFVYPGNWAEHLTWASVFAYVLTQGPGALSVDHFIRRSYFGGRS